MSTPKDAKPAWWTNDHWGTPKKVVRLLERTFEVKFEIDPCCTLRTKKAPIGYTEDDNGLIKPWNGNVFLNPPYSNPLPWIRRAARLTRRGHCPFVCALLPPAFDTDWFHDWVLPWAELHFIRGRIAFIGWKGTPIKNTRQGNFVAIYRSGGLNVEYNSYSLSVRDL